MNSPESSDTKKMTSASRLDKKQERYWDFLLILSEWISSQFGPFLRVKWSERTTIYNDCNTIVGAGPVESTFCFMVKFENNCYWYHENLRI